MSISAAPPFYPTLGTDIANYGLAKLVMNCWPPYLGAGISIVELAPGTTAPRHTHPGEEIIYVLFGTIEYEIGGQWVTVKSGDVLFVPDGAVHAARNVGAEPAAELATYVLEKGKPLTTLAE